MERLFALPEPLPRHYSDASEFKVVEEPRPVLMLTDSGVFAGRPFMKFRFAPLALALIGCVTTSHAKISVGNGGISVSGSGADSYLFKYPQLINAAQKPAAKLMDTTVSGAKAHLKYDDGTVADVTVAGNQLKFQFTKGSAAVKAFKLDSQLGFNMLGAKWRVDSKPFEPVPENKPAKPHIYQGSGKTFEFSYLSGATLSATVPSGTYIQFTDCREWGWKNYNLSFGVPFQSAVTLSFSAKGSGQVAGEPSKNVLTDKFGQYALKDWPGKVKSEEELTADAQKEAGFYASYRPPELDRFGGLPGSKEKYGFKQTGYFHVEKKDGRWYLVNPDGNWHFYLGVCSFASYPNNVQPKGKENTYEWLPALESEYKSAFGQNGGGVDDGKFNFYIANRIRKYGQPYDVKNFTEQMIGRVRKFGFNAAGAFGAGDKSAREAMNFPYVVELPLRTWQGIKHLPGLRETWDPFDEEIRAKVDNNLKRLAPGTDPLLIGWYLVNEPLYEDIPRVVPGYKENVACKRRLVKMLEEKYKAIDAFNSSWGTALASFDEAAKQGLPVKTKAASADMEAFKELFLEEYFKFTSETARKYDPNHMLMGCRFQSGTINNEAVCRIGSKYMDVWSFNYYTYGLDEQFLAKIQKWVGDKPMILSEFHWNSSSDSGVLGGAKDVSSQQERGLAYRHYVEQAACLPYIVGVEWYTLIDGAVAGFNANCGLFNVVDRPWKKMIDEMVKTNYEIYNIAAGQKERFVHNDPKFSGKEKGGRVMIADRVTTPLKIDGQGGDWPGVPAERIGGANQLVQGASAEGFESATKVCWNDEYLYVIADVADETPMLNKHKGRDLWDADGVELFMGAEQMEKGGQLLFTDRHLLLSAGTEDNYHYFNAPEQYECQVAVAPKAGGGYTLETAVPWKAIGIKPEANKEILFDIAINDSSDGSRRERQLIWSGTLKNSTDRTHWGKLRLVTAK